MFLTRKARWWLAGSSALFVLALILWAGGDSHRTNFRYWIWKQTGWGYGDPMEPLRFINVDVEFRESLIGKTPSELQRWLPLRPFSEKGQYTGYGQEFLAGRDFSWIGPSTWAVEWKNGRATRIFAVKGV